jgi:hypothetical protein
MQEYCRCYIMRKLNEMAEKLQRYYRDHRSVRTYKKKERSSLFFQKGG